MSILSTFSRRTKRLLINSIFGVLLHSGRPKLYAILVFLRAIRLTSTLGLRNDACFFLAIFIFASIFIGCQHLKERICSLGTDSLLICCFYFGRAANCLGKQKGNHRSCTFKKENSKKTWRCPQQPSPKWHNLLP